MHGDKEVFEFTPSNPWGAVGWRERHTTSLEVAPPLNRKGIEFVACRVEKIDAQANRLRLENGSELDYDYLLITTGSKLAFNEVPGGYMGACGEGGLREILSQ